MTPCGAQTNDLHRQYGPKLTLRVIILISWEGRGVVSAGKRAICDHVRLLKLVRKRAIALLCALFF